MRRFVVETVNDGVKFFTCNGDNYGKCRLCKARFLCYTGELTGDYCEPCSNYCGPYRFNYGLYANRVEFHLFGRISDIIRWDSELWDEYYYETSENFQITKL